MAKEQVHGKFKVFVGDVAADGSIGALAQQVASFVSDARIAPKSIGVECLESSGKLVLSLGYRDDEAAYGIKLESHPIGSLGSLDAGDVSRLESAMTKVTATLGDIICHELFVTKDGTCRLVVMRRA